MSGDTLIIYSTTDGHTRKICQRLQQVIEQQGEYVTLLPIADVSSSTLASFAKIVIGASIRYGKHHKQVYEFVERNENLLDNKINAFFSVNVVARKPEKNQPETNPYMIKFLKQISWKPKALAVFSGRLDYRQQRFLDRQMIRLIMWITHGPTDLDAVAEFTDWQQVEAFGRHIAEM